MARNQSIGTEQPIIVGIVRSLPTFFLYFRLVALQACFFTRQHKIIIIIIIVIGIKFGGVTEGRWNDTLYTVYKLVCKLMRACDVPTYVRCRMLLG